MMRIAKELPSSPSPAPAEPQWAEAHVAVEAGNRYLLDDGRLAQQAVSCLVTPEAGDRVLVVACQPSGAGVGSLGNVGHAGAGKVGENYIVHVLQRPVSGEASLSVPGAQQLTFRQSRIALHSTEQIALRSLRDIEVTAGTGVLTLTARNLFTSVSESLVENIRHYVGSVEQYLLDVKQVLRLRGKQASITAEQDVKVDAERISIG